MLALDYFEECRVGECLAHAIEVLKLAARLIAQNSISHRRAPVSIGTWSSKRVRQRDLRLERVDPAGGFLEVQVRRLPFWLVGLLGKVLQPLGLGAGHRTRKLVRYVAVFGGHGFIFRFHSYICNLTLCSLFVRAIHGQQN